MKQREYDTGADMIAKSATRSHRVLARIALLLLVAIPFIPEIIITLVSALACLMGCRPDQAEVCRIGSLAVSDIINWAFQMGAGARVAASLASLPGFYLAIAWWLAMCHVAVTLGWARVASRLLLGLAVTVVFTVLPYFGPWLAIANYVRKDTCDPNSGKACMIFGGEVSDVYAAVRVTAPELLYGGLLAIGIFLIYAVVVSVKGAVSARRPAEVEQQNA